MSREMLKHVPRSAFCERIGIHPAAGHRLAGSAVSAAALYYFNGEGEIIAQVQFHYDPISGAPQAEHYLVDNASLPITAGSGLWF